MISRGMWRRSLVAAVVAMSGLLGGADAASASPITYTFSGVGTGDVGTTAFSGAFTFSFTGNTTGVFPGVTPAGIEFFNTGLGGTFSEGSVVETLLSTNVVIVNINPSNPRLGFFNGTVTTGAVIQNTSFTTYDLATAFGPVTGTGGNLFPDLPGSGFGTTGGPTIELFTISSLTFTASVPEPGTIALFGVGLLALGMLGRRRRRA